MRRVPLVLALPEGSEPPEDLIHQGTRGLVVEQGSAASHDQATEDDPDKPHHQELHPSSINPERRGGYPGPAHEAGPRPWRVITSTSAS